jgi:hypothetical protein
MSSIAVFMMLGGATAIAASKIGTKQLKANSVTTGKIKKNAVTTAKIKNNAVNGAKVNESTLGTVPSATNATNAENANTANNANTVGGNTVKAVNFTANPTTGPTEILNLNGFTLTASCGAGAVLSVLANGPDGSRVQSVGLTTGRTVVNGLLVEPLTPTSNTELLFEDDDLVLGHTELYLGNGGKNVSVQWQAESFGGVDPQCAFTGSAIG